jgi:hypothetical protein
MLGGEHVDEYQWRRELRVIALALLLSWLAPLANCDGSPLTDLAGFTLWTERIVKTGQTVAPDGSVTDTSIRTFLTVPLPASTLETNLSDPEPGGMIAYRIGSVDWTGNPDCQTERPTP